MQRISISSITKTLSILTFITLITFSPSISFINYIDYHDCQRIIQLLLLGLVLIDAIFLNFSKSGLIPINNNIRLGFFGLLALSTASTTHAITPRYAIIETSIFAALCYLALFVARLYRENGEIFVKYLTYALWASILLYMTSFYTGYITALAVKKTLTWPFPFYGFSNIRLFQQYQLWGLGLLCLPLLAFDLKKNVRFWFQFALACWWILLFYAASRGVTLSWIIAIVATAIVYKKIAWGFLRIQLTTAIAGLCAYQLLFKIIPNLLTSSSNAVVASTIFRDTFSDRTDLWKAAYVMIDNFPLLGVGPMHFYFYNTFGTHPHNSVLQIASEWGLPASLIILALTGYCFYCWLKKFNASQLDTNTKLDKNLSIILFFTIISGSSYSLVEGVIVMPISQVLMFTTIGLMIGQYTEKTLFTINTEPIKFRPRFRPVFALFVLVFMATSTMPELIRGITSDNRILSSWERPFSIGPGINPRIWMQQRRKD